MPDIYLGHGKDCGLLTARLLEAADIKSRVPKNANVIIKPNLVNPTKPEHGATTHVGIVEAIVCYLLEQCGVKSITVAEGAWIGAKTAEAFSVCGYNELAKKYGVKLLDTKKDKLVSVTARGIDLKVCAAFLEADYFVNVPVLKGHSQTKMTCCLKNLKGCIPDSEKSRYHQIGLHKPIAALTTVLKPDLHVIDSICGDPTFEEGGRPLQTDRMLLGFDPVLLDSYCSGLIDVDYRAVRYLCLAQEWGVGKFSPDKPNICEIGRENRPDVAFTRDDTVSYLAEFIEEDGACSACYAALISALNQMTGDMPADGEIKIGQGFRGQQPDGVGVGNCTAGCAKHLSGCPPTAAEMLDFLRTI
ncbi:MAG: DUF362 domain-containing protein [Oscillospiraceae bacterium]|nr:DUF362 domain-containing protein [Oscillospiraceae bacterium]